MKENMKKIYKSKTHKKFTKTEIPTKGKKAKEALRNKKNTKKEKKMEEKSDLESAITGTRSFHIMNFIFLLTNPTFNHHNFPNFLTQNS